MKVKGKNYKSIWLDKKKSVVVVIDQRLLPHQFKLLYLKNINDIKKAIKEMVVRGAPLIGVTAAYRKIQQTNVVRLHISRDPARASFPTAAPQKHAFLGLPALARLSLPAIARCK